MAAAGTEYWQAGAWSDPANAAAAAWKIREGFGAGADVRQEVICVFEERSEESLPTHSIHAEPLAGPGQRTV